MLALVAGALVLSACGASEPPSTELANEIIDTLEKNGEPLSDSVKTCMKDVVANFELTETEATGFKDLNDVVAKADQGQEQAKQIMSRFEDELTACNTAG